MYEVRDVHTRSAPTCVVRSRLFPLKEACVRVRIARRRALAWCGLGYFFVSFDEVGGEVVRRDTGGLTITPNPGGG